MQVSVTSRKKFECDIRLHLYLHLRDRVRLQFTWWPYMQINWILTRYFFTPTKPNNMANGV